MAGIHSASVQSVLYPFEDAGTEGALVLASEKTERFQDEIAGKLSPVASSFDSAVSSLAVQDELLARIEEKVGGLSFTRVYFNLADKGASSLNVSGVSAKTLFLLVYCRNGVGGLTERSLMRVRTAYEARRSDIYRVFAVGSFGSGGMKLRYRQFTLASGGESTSAVVKLSWTTGYYTNSAWTYPQTVDTADVNPYAVYRIDRQG